MLRLGPRLFSLENCFGLYFRRDPRIFRRAALAQGRQRHAVTTISIERSVEKKSIKRLTECSRPRNDFSARWRTMNSIAELAWWMEGFECQVALWSVNQKPRDGGDCGVPPFKKRRVAHRAASIDSRCGTKKRGSWLGFPVVRSIVRTAAHENRGTQLEL